MKVNCRDTINLFVCVCVCYLIIVLLSFYIGTLVNVFFSYGNFLFKVYLKLVHPF